MTDENESDAESEVVDQQQEQQQEDTNKDNPSWTEAWGDFTPEPVREHQREVFKKWDDGYKELEVRYAPFKQFETAGLTPEIIAQAIQLQDRIASDPRDFYDRMGTHWGFSKQEQSAVDTAQKAIDEGEEVPSWAKDIISRMDQQQQIAEQEYQQQITAQQEQQQVSAVNSSLDALETKFGKFDRERIIRQALANSVAGGNPSVENAFFEVQKERDAWLAEQQGKRPAPKVVGGQGRVPSTQSQEPRKIETPEELRARAMSIAAQLAAGN